MTRAFTRSVRTPGRLLGLFVALLSVLAVHAVAQPALKTMRIALRDDPDVLDPTFARTYNGRLVFAGLCDKLFDIDEKLTITPKLATGYEWADSKTMLLHVRPGVKFHDGEEMDAAAVNSVSTGT